VNRISFPADDGIECRLCSGATSYLFSARLLGTKVNYYECVQCDLVQTEKPNWINKAYESPINIGDTGIVKRAKFCRDIIIVSAFILNVKGGEIVDAGGGTGLLVRMCRDLGLNAFWQDKFCHNIFANGFEVNESQFPVKIISAFEVIEHFDEPEKQLAELFEKAENVLLSTHLIPSPAPMPNKWWYYGLDHGQHIAFFRTSTLNYLAKKYGFYLISDGKSIHLFSQKKINKVLWLFCIKTKHILVPFLSFFMKGKTESDSQYLTQGKKDGS